MDKIDKRLYTGIRYLHVPEMLTLIVITSRAALKKPFPCIRRNKEASSRTDFRIKLSQKNVHSRKVQVPEMIISVGNIFQPSNKIPVLRVPAYKQQLVARQNLLKERFLPADKAEILRIFNAHHSDLRSRAELLEIRDISKGPLWRADCHESTFQKTRDRFITVPQEAEHAAGNRELGIAREVNKVRTLHCRRPFKQSPDGLPCRKIQIPLQETE